MNELEELNKLSRESIIAGEERSIKHETMTVNNLTRHYVKGLVKIDGRK